MARKQTKFSVVPSSDQRIRDALRHDDVACGACCEARGAREPDHDVTMHQGNCYFCGQTTAVSSVRDRTWPGQTRRMWD